MLFNQCVASRCVLQIFDLKSWVKCNYNLLLFTVRTLKQTSGLTHFWSEN